MNDGEGSENVPFSQVVMEVMRKLEGPYALIFKIPHYPNELVACKRGIPLLLGIKELTEDKNGDCCLFIVTLVVMKRAFKITKIPPDQPAKCYTFIEEATEFPKK